MCDQPESAVDRLLAQARASSVVNGTVDAVGDAMRSCVRTLDSALAQLQDDPEDTGARIVRALVLRGTLENVLHASVEVCQRAVEGGEHGR